MPRDTSGLTPWKPGQSGNPAGYSQKRRLTDALHRLLDKMGEEEFVKVGLDAAKDRDFNFWRYIFERIDGPMAAKLEADVKTDERRVVILPAKPSDRGDGGPAGPPDGVPPE